MYLYTKQNCPSCITVKEKYNHIECRDIDAQAKDWCEWRMCLKDEGEVEFTVPVLVCGKKVIRGSHKILKYMDKEYEAPSDPADETQCDSCQ
jgi:glutaredoxin